MEITEIRVKLMQNAQDKLRAFVTITLTDTLVVRDLKVIEGPEGLFVAMPSRRVMDRCPLCRCKNHVRARYCNECGGEQRANRALREPDGRPRLHADIAHPINADSRKALQERVLDAYYQEYYRSQLPGYHPQSWPDD